MRGSGADPVSHNGCNLSGGYRLRGLRNGRTVGPSEPDIP